MTTVTLNLPEPILQRANKAAAVLHRSLEEVLAATLASALPDVEDAPDDMQAELLQMTWLDDRELLKRGGRLAPPATTSCGLLPGHRRWFGDK